MSRAGGAGERREGAAEAVEAEEAAEEVPSSSEAAMLLVLSARGRHSRQSCR
jgi:hypothetical protein